MTHAYKTMCESHIHFSTYATQYFHNLSRHLHIKFLHICCSQLNQNSRIFIKNIYIILLIVRVT